MVILEDMVVIIINHSIGPLAGLQSIPRVSCTRYVPQLHVGPGLLSPVRQSANYRIIIVPANQPVR